MSHTPGPWYCHFAAAVGEQSEGGPDSHLPKDERECVLAASRYADAHWKPGLPAEEEETACA